MVYRPTAVLITVNSNGKKFAEQ